MKTFKPHQKQAAAPRGDVEEGDHIYVHHGGQPCCGRVLCHGRHGVTVDVGGQQQRVKWDKVLGHKQRVPMKFEVLEHGEDGMLVRDHRGRQRFINVPPEAREVSGLAKALSVPGVVQHDEAITMTQGGREIILFFKAHVSGYTRKDGTYVAPHEDKRQAAKQEAPKVRPNAVPEVKPAPKQSVHPTETESFKKWFGDSKVVDEKGKPLVVYHGTTEDFSEFKPKRGGIYFSPDLEYSRDVFAAKSEHSGRVLEVYLKVEKPFEARWKRMDAEGKAELQRIVDEVFDEDDINDIREKLDDPDWNPFDSFTDGELWLDGGRGMQDRLLSAIKDAGYDGVFMPDSPSAGWNLDAFVVFNPNQIKSATGNNGNFDSQNPDMTKSNQSAVLFFKALPQQQAAAPEQQQQGGEGWTERPDGAGASQAGQHVAFRNGEFRGHGRVAAAGEHGVTVQDQKGGQHRVLHDQITHHWSGDGEPSKAPPADEQDDDDAVAGYDGKVALPGELVAELLKTAPRELRAKAAEFLREKSAGEEVEKRAVAATPGEEEKS